MNLLLLTVVLALEFTDLPKPLQKKIDNLYGTIYKPEFKQASEQLSAEERTQVISWMKDEILRDGHEASRANIAVLVNFGDDEAIAKEAAAFPYQSLGGRSFLIDSIQPKVIPVLVPWLLSEAPAPPGSHMDYPDAFLVSLFTRDIIARSPYFPTPVRQWAASWQGKVLGDPPNIFTNTMRKWWLANEQYFKSGNYELVRPGDPAPPDGPTPVIVRVPAPPPLPTPFPHPSETASVSTPSPQPTPAPAGGSGLGLLAAILATAAATTALMFWTRKR